MKSYKGFDNNLKCRDFQYEIGKEYEETEAIVCEKGFHACEFPFDVFRYYPPATSRYCEVEQDGKISRESNSSKISSTKIKVKAEIGLKGIIDASVKFILEKSKKDNNEQINASNQSAAINTGDWSAATNTGNWSAAINTGDWSAATSAGDQSVAANTGDQSAATNTGNQSAATNTGYHSAATNTGSYSTATNTGERSVATNAGDWSIAANTGDRSAATNTGDKSAATNTGPRSSATNTGYRSVAANTGCRSVATNAGYQSVATNTGDYSDAEVLGSDSIAVAVGYNCKAKANVGSAIVIAERGEYNGRTYPLIAIKSAIVDGKIIKADTWYTVKNGEFVEVQDD